MSHQVFCGLRFRDCKSQYVYVIYVHLSSLLCYTLRGPQNFFKPCKLIRPLVTQIKFKVPVPYPLADPLTSPHGVAEIPHQSQQCQSSPWPSRDAFTMACRQKIPRFLISENNIFVIDKKALYASIYTLGFLFYQISFTFLIFFGNVHHFPWGYEARAPFPPPPVFFSGAFLCSETRVCHHPTGSALLTVEVLRDLKIHLVDMKFPLLGMVETW